MPAPAASALQIQKPWRERTAKLEPEIASRANAGERETARREPLGVTGSGERAGKQAEAGRDEAAAEAGGGTEARGREGEQAEAERREIPVVGP